jgi:excinuclease UvrABC nuclease subunit
MTLFDLWGDSKQTVALDAIERTPNLAAVFLVWPKQDGQPYLGRTNLLRRRLLRLLKERDKPSRMLNLREVSERVDYWLTGSQLESSLLLYRLARQHFPDSYLKLVKLRMPAYLKLILSNEYPRASITTRVTGGKGIYYGPFRTRAGAETFQSQCLDLFQIRRCEENLEPRPEHPGCIYGEMNMCLRPCQQIVSAGQYAGEVDRVAQFLRTDGGNLIETASAARDRFSEELNFEEAAKQHRKIERIKQILGLRDDLVTDLDRLNGVAVAAASADAGAAVNLLFLRRGWWHGPVRFDLGPGGTQAVSMDRRLKEMIQTLPAKDPGSAERQEHLALLAKWFYSTWRDGEFLAADALGDLPYRKVVNAIARVAKGVVAATATLPPGSA